MEDMTTSTPGQGTYRPLQASQFRLLRLETQNLAGVHDVCISGELVIADLDSSSIPKFTALSYAWASEERPCQILISGQAVEVTDNLFAALHAITKARSSKTTAGLTTLVSRTRAALIWIDAICINQADDAEKASQVRKMARIYGSATTTIMWLGDATRDSRFALDWLFAIARIEEAAFDTMTDDAKINDLFNEAAWNGLCDLILRLYFRRRWIIEEAALSLDPWIVCGEQAIDWTTFFTGYDRVCGVIFNLLHQRHYTLRSTDIEAIAGIGMLRERLLQKKHITLLETLVRFRRCGTVKGRDRIFAFLGLCSDAEAQRIRINYERSMQLDDLFKQQVITHIATWNNLDVLCVCQERVRIERRQQKVLAPRRSLHRSRSARLAVMMPLANLPTWAPNWTSPRGEWFLGPDDRAVNAQWHAIFNAAAGTVPDVLNSNLAPISDRLCVGGIQVDSVLAIEQTTPPPVSGPEESVFKFLHLLLATVSAPTTTSDTLSKQGRAPRCLLAHADTRRKEERIERALHVGLHPIFLP